MDTTVLLNDFNKAGFKTLICAADADLISKDKVGMDFSKEFLEPLLEGVDPCGENGEFRSFCYVGPIFGKALKLEVDEILSKSYDIPLTTGAVDKKHYWFAAIHSLGSKSY